MYYLRPLTLLLSFVVTSLAATLSTPSSNSVASSTISSSQTSHAFVSGLYLNKSASAIISPNISSLAALRVNGTHLTNQSLTEALRVNGTHLTNQSALAILYPNISSVAALRVNGTHLTNQSLTEDFYER